MDSISWTAAIWAVVGYLNICFTAENAVIFMKWTIFRPT